MKLFLLYLTIFTAGCCASKKQPDGAAAKQASATPVQTDSVKNVYPTPYPVGPVAIIYKTRKNYFDKVAVTMNDAKTQIVSYPAPKDVFMKGELAYPTKLDSGYLLTNLGIGIHTVFLNITLEEYSKRTNVLPMNEMMQLILDKDPFTTIYTCGNRRLFKDVVNDLNNAIENKQLNKYMRLL